MSKIIITDEAIEAIILKIKVNIFITAVYGADLRKVGKDIQDKVKAQIENMTPYKLSAIVVFIEDIKYEEQE
jgi:uncharacterized alkaline shock family protein YloU